MKRWLVVGILAGMSLVGMVRAESLSVGGPGAFLNYGLGAKGEAMGGAMTAMIGDPLAMLANPGALALITAQSVSSTYIVLPGGGDFSQIAYALPLAAFRVPENGQAGSISSLQLGGLGVYLTRLAVSYQIEARTTDSLNPDYFFSDIEGVYGLSMGLPLGATWGAGLSVKGLYHLVEHESAQGWGLDAGFYYKPWDALTLAAMVHNGYTSFYWTTGHRELAAPQFTLGTGYHLDLQPSVALTVNTQVEKELSQASFAYALGMEAGFFKFLAVRAGYDGYFSTGLGVTWPKFGWAQADLKLDYALVQDAIRDWDHWLTLQLSF